MNTSEDQIYEFINIDKISFLSGIELNFDAKNRVQKYISANKVQFESSDSIPGTGIPKFILIIVEYLSYNT